MPLAEPAHLPLGPEGAYAVTHGLYRLSANLARRGRWRCWSTTPTGPTLRRCASWPTWGTGWAGCPLLLVVAARPLGEPGGAAVAEMLSEGGAPALLRPPALGDDASAALLRAAVPGPSRRSAAPAMP